MVSLAKFFGRAASDAAGYAIGGAVSPVLKPAIQDLENVAWLAHTVLPLEATILAEGVAQGQIDRTFAVGEAALTGINEQRFNALVHIFDTGPGIAQGYNLWRRGLIDEAGFRRAAKREGLEPEWVDALVAAKPMLLTPAELANARQQGYIEQARQYDEAEKWGVDNERAELQFLLSGLPPGPETGLEMLRRSIINEAEFGDLIREGHTKTKYIDEYLALRHPILSASQATTLRIKGWIDAPAQHALGALSGYTAEQMDQLFLAAGRPAAPGQMWTAAARGIDGPDGVPMNQAQFLKGIRESDIRPEWGPMLWEIRYLYPSLFQLTRLVTSGQIDADTGAEWAHKARYAPEVVTALKASWAGGTSATGDPHVGRAETQLWTTLHNSFKARESNVTQARPVLTQLGIPRAAQDQIIALWTAERDLTRKQLTAAQIKKTWAKGGRNDATGQPWTTDEAIAALVAQGFDDLGARNYLDVPPTPGT